MHPHSLNKLQKIAWIWAEAKTQAILTETVARQQLSCYTTALVTSRHKNTKLIKALKAFISGPMCT